jgi:hypothetical protein
MLGHQGSSHEDGSAQRGDLLQDQRRGYNHEWRYHPLMGSLELLVSAEHDDRMELSANLCQKPKVSRAGPSQPGRVEAKD